MSQGPSFPHFLTNHENSTKRLMQEAEKCQEKQKRERERVHGSCMKRLQPLDAPPLESSPWGLAMRLLAALLLLWVPGSLCLSGPSTVSGAVGGSLSVQCRYKEEYKEFDKYWCRQPCLLIWHQAVETRGANVEVRSGRVSIVDRPEDLTFTVTLENLTAQDAGKYRCGVATILQEEGLLGFLPDPFFQVQVIVPPASSSNSSTGMPEPLSRQQGSQLSSIHFLLLVFLKVPLLLGMLSAVLWVHRPQGAICGETQPA
ncbi:CMRF35-like molecule 6 isoform X1 [Sus scrofa]|uniref:Ig-like domain-containing protein n=3 Tax=Sus scrofa TaxID=9823 RepID=A0A8D1IJ69_PIG|nr:CMRF35-like molecule 6 isoform X1 [Sus scrofa]